MLLTNRLFIIIITWQSAGPEHSSTGGSGGRGIQRCCDPQIQSGWAGVRHCQSPRHSGSRPRQNRASGSQVQPGWQSTRGSG